MTSSSTLKNPLPVYCIDIRIFLWQQIFVFLYEALPFLIHWVCCVMVCFSCECTSSVGKWGMMVLSWNLGQGGQLMVSCVIQACGIWWVFVMFGLMLRYSLLSKDIIYATLLVVHGLGSFLHSVKLWVYEVWAVIKWLCHKFQLLIL